MVAIIMMKMSMRFLIIMDISSSGFAFNDSLDHSQFLAHKLQSIQLLKSFLGNLDKSRSNKILEFEVEVGIEDARICPLFQMEAQKEVRATADLIFCHSSL